MNTTVYSSSIVSNSNVVVSATPPTVPWRLDEDLFSPESLKQYQQQQQHCNVVFTSKTTMDNRNPTKFKKDSFMKEGLNQHGNVLAKQDKTSFFKNSFNLSSILPNKYHHTQSPFKFSQQKDNAIKNEKSTAAAAAAAAAASSSSASSSAATSFDGPFACDPDWWSSGVDLCRVNHREDSDSAWLDHMITSFSTTAPAAAAAVAAADQRRSHRRQAPRSTTRKLRRKHEVDDKKKEMLLVSRPKARRLMFSILNGRTSSSSSSCVQGASAAANEEKTTAFTGAPPPSTAKNGAETIKLTGTTSGSSLDRQSKDLINNSSRHLLPPQERPLVEEYPWPALASTTTTTPLDLCNVSYTRFSSLSSLPSRATTLETEKNAAPAQQDQPQQAQQQHEPMTNIVLQETPPPPVPAMPTTTKIRTLHINTMFDHDEDRNAHTIPLVVFVVKRQHQQPQQMALSSWKNASESEMPTTGARTSNFAPVSVFDQKNQYSKNVSSSSNIDYFCNLNSSFKSSRNYFHDDNKVHDDEAEFLTIHQDHHTVNHESAIRRPANTAATTANTAATRPIAAINTTTSLPSAAASSKSVVSKRTNRLLGRVLVRHHQQHLDKKGEDDGTSFSPESDFFGSSSFLDTDDDNEYDVEDDYSSFAPSDYSLAPAQTRKRMTLLPSLLG
jgi:hypothetical protein